MRWILPILALAVLSCQHAGAFSAEEALERAAADSWHAGLGLLPGDSFTYQVCDHVRAHHLPDGPCYVVVMEFHIELISRDRDTWVVQAEITGDGTYRHIFLVDTKTMGITTDLAGSAYAGSVEGTVGYLARFAHELSPKRLGVGSVWGDVPSVPGAGSVAAVVSREVWDVGDVSVIEFGLFEHSTFAVSGSLPFPVSGIMYGMQHLPDPPALFSFELLGYDPGCPPPANGTAAGGPGSCTVPDDR